ncbi:MAG: hypothetical protein Q3M24_02110 [Candidatus Electrothrix aestuarii]|uniref:Uncharacterized protein n=1 Tax=Candidatus Electrothrix aestuarii TaxID=3062594 RepID=A0AAU8LXG7_9BACT|nr:hypothetical protein [Candidatus Electrothrix aestuarii]
MTVISVGIQKTDETDEWVKYAFGGPPTRIIGNVIIYKSDGQVNLIDIEHDKYRKYILPAVVKALIRHHEKGEYPDNTGYHA